MVGAIDDRITLLRETNTTLEAIAQALFKSWFVDFDPVHDKMQGLAPEGMDEATAALFPDSFEESELGAVPRGWQVLAVEDFAVRVGMGPFGSNIKVETFVDSGIPVISGQHLKQLLVEDNTFNYITPEHAQRLSKSSVQAGDVIFTHAGSIGQVSLLHKDAAFPSYVLSQRQFFLRCNEKLVNPEWVALYFRSPAGQHKLLANTSQVGVPSIARPVSYLRSIRLVTPPPNIGQRFASIAGSINDRVMANRKQLDALISLRNTLLPRLISGQLSLGTDQ
jgi:type I restriction enzyme S subunit